MFYIEISVFPVLLFFFFYTPDSQLNYTFVQLTAVQWRVNHGNLMNIFVYRNHVDYYSLSSTFPSVCLPSTQVYRIGVMK